MLCSNQPHIDSHDAENDLASLVDRAAAGEEIVITKDDKPVARIVGIDQEAAAQARPGPRFGAWAHYGWTLPRDFDDPDPEIEALFNG